MKSDKEGDLMPKLFKKAREFWLWFESEEQNIGKLLDPHPDKKLINGLSSRISFLYDGLGWEIGPGVHNEKQFVITPNRDQKRLQMIRKIISLAPALPAWEFLPAKPRKSWNYEMEIIERRKIVKVNFQDWTYKLTGFSGNSFFDIDFYVDRFEKDIDEKTYAKFSVLLVESEIGEELMIERIDRINVHPRNSNSEILEGLTPVKYLFKHLQDLLS